MGTTSVPVARVPRPSISTVAVFCVVFLVTTLLIIKYKILISGLFDISINSVDIYTQTKLFNYIFSVDSTVIFPQLETTS
jgi:hypothetical protein